VGVGGVGVSVGVADNDEDPTYTHVAEVFGFANVSCPFSFHGGRAKL